MSNTLKIFTDGGARGNPGPAGIGVHVEDAQGNTVFKHARYIGHATNNEAEYKAVLMSLEWLGEAIKQRSIDKVEWYLDSMLVVEQLNKKWKIKKDDLRVFATKIWTELQSLALSYTFSHIPRENNKEADALVNQAIDAALV